MPIEYRAAQIDSANPSDITSIQPPPHSLRPDIPVWSRGGDDAAATGNPAVLTDTTPLSVTPTPTPSPIPTTTVSTSAATLTHTSAASHGLPPSKLAVAIVIPIAFLAILIPVLVLWFLNHRRKLQERKNASQRSSHSRDPMIQKLHEPMIERQPSYKGPAPARPLRTPANKRSRHQSIQEPSSAQTRDSLGLFNFELSPTTPRTPKVLRTPESEASPQFRFSVARALEMRRSQPSIVQPHAHTSDTSVTPNPSAIGTARPGTRGSNRGSASSIFDPPPPYASPRPSESAAAKSHFAPLSRIGTRNLADRSPPRTAARLHNAEVSEETDRSTYASSDAIRAPDTYGRVHIRSSSPSPEWPPPPQPQGVVARKPVPSQEARVISHSTSPHKDSNLNGPFEPYLPERMSDVSGFSIDTSRWGGEEPSRQDSTVSSLHSIGSPNDSNASTMQPHHLV